MLHFLNCYFVSSFSLIYNISITIFYYLCNIITKQKGMDSLFSLQLVCCTVTTLLMMMLACSRLQLQWTSLRYETSRWILCFSMFVLSIHYILQMRHGIRASGDDVGAAFNILFYSPVAFLIQYAIYNIEGSRTGRKKNIILGFAQYLIIIATFITGKIVNGSNHLSFFLYIMAAVFTIAMIAFIINNINAISRRRKNIEQETAADLMPYDRYTWSSFLLLCTSALLVCVAILYRPLLFIIGPLMLFALFVFTVSFIGFGYNIRPIEAIMSDEDEEEAEEKPENIFSENKTKMIDEALKVWIDNGGYRDSSANIVTLAESTNIRRQDLTTYFKQCRHCSFRTWLSDIRFEKAKEMLITAKHYSNDAISSECGFSSHTQLYRIFKTKTGMSPGQYKESLQ